MHLSSDLSSDLALSQVSAPHQCSTAVKFGNTKKTRGPSRKKSRTLSAEIQSEIQKSNLKSRNPLWNPEIQMIQDTIKILRAYTYTLN